jgi:polyphosphate glucokinase
MQVLGIDIGGSGMKAAIVDTQAGSLLTERIRRETPEGGHPRDMLAVVDELIQAHDWKGPVGIGFPGVAQAGVIRTAANVDDAWIGFDLREAVSRQLDGQPVSVINDADAAGLAEARFGAGHDHSGLVILLTVGTGIGTALIHDGELIPNSELGHILLPKGVAEALLSQVTRKAEDISWKRWSGRFSVYLQKMENLLWPDLFILGGGGAKKPDRILPHLECRTQVIPAQFGNRAGILGAALPAARLAG